jgi:hypothetical protein
VPNKVLKASRVRISENQRNVFKKTIHLLVRYVTKLLYMIMEVISQHKTHCFGEV